ncbi:MAG: fascin domain-containing protein, partial [Opitutaceae bacterium]
LFESGVEVGLRTANGLFLCAEGGGGSTLVANRWGVGAWETFRIHRLAGPGLISTGDAVSLQAVENGHYWCAVNGGGGIVDANRTGVGSWETFTITVDYQTDRSADSVWIDINGDGIRDEVVRHGSQNFRFGIDYWDTYCYDYYGYPMESSFFDVGYGWGGLIGYVPGFSEIFEPELFWIYNSIYSYCETYIEPSIRFETRAGESYRVYQDTSGSDTFNPANWEEIITIDNASEGMNHVSLGSDYAENFYLGQIFLVRIANPPLDLGDLVGGHFTPYTSDNPVGDFYSNFSLSWTSSETISGPTVAAAADAIFDRLEQLIGRELLETEKSRITTFGCGDFARTLMRQYFGFQIRYPETHFPERDKRWDVKAFARYSDALAFSCSGNTRAVYIIVQGVWTHGSPPTPDGQTGEVPIDSVTAPVPGGNYIVRMPPPNEGKWFNVNQGVGNTNKPQIGYVFDDPPPETFPDVAQIFLVVCARKQPPN